MDPMVLIFRALGDPSRRLLLDQLFKRDGQTLGELCSHLPGMTRFGVMRHLGVLEGADLISTRRSGREKRHYLNPVPIRLIHDRWISKYAEPVVGALAALKDHLEVGPMIPDHVYSIFVKASPERIWKAIVDGDETSRYFYGTRVTSDWTPGAPISYTYPDGTVAADGQVIAFDPPHRLEMTFHARWDPEIEQDGPVRQAWEIEATGDGISKLSVITSGMVAGSKTEREFTGGLPYILSGLKSLIETGQSLAAA
jgi:uncharacterized protein YndB with AHSA1/START domain/DNA-binding transcriptional ArsR family regulator